MVLRHGDSRFKVHLSMISLNLNDYRHRDKNVLNSIEIHTLHQITPRNLWMEDAYLFEQIKAIFPSENFHEISKYQLAWTPPYSSTMTFIPLHDIELQESMYHYFSSHHQNSKHPDIIFSLVTSHPSIPVFAPKVHPASLVSYRTKLEIFNKLCGQYSQGLISLNELHDILLHGVNVWKKVLYRNLPDDERVYHEYLNEPVVSAPKVTENNVEQLYVEGEVPFNVFHDLKFAERARIRDQELLPYPRPYAQSPCVVCGGERGVIQCGTCENRVCTDCVLRLYGDSEHRSESNVLTLHRYHCLKRSRVAEVAAYVVPPPSYLMELRLTGREAALARLPPEEPHSEIDEGFSSEGEGNSVSEDESVDDAEPTIDALPAGVGELRLRKLEKWLQRRVHKFAKLKRKIDKHRSRAEDTRRSKRFRDRERALLDKYQARVTKYLDRHSFAANKLRSFDEDTKLLPLWSALRVQLAVFRDDVRLYEDGGLAASGGPLSNRSVATESQRAGASIPLARSTK